MIQKIKIDKRLFLIGLTIFVVIVLDQTLKVWVKTHMTYGQKIPIFDLDWAYIYFVENPGMAFGILIGGEFGKLILSLFRILAVIFLSYYISLLIRLKVPLGLLVSFSLILAGAIGNIIDSAFYGMLFTASTARQVAEFLPLDGGYAAFLHGNVVDMFYFPVLELAGVYPRWIPGIGGAPYHYKFFKPVFNIADVAISIGVLNILLFQREFFKTHHHTEEEDGSTEVPFENDLDSPIEEQHN